jgi:EAL domain-containing protein (putative c-di-GMP-specific phosphodiesterase class I)/putative methionine-R-sulfoxide reductase with GAF domain
MAARHVELARIPALAPRPERARRQSEHAFLRDLLQAQGAILGAGLDPARVVAAIVERAARLTRSEGAVLEVLDGPELVYGTACGSLANSIGLRIRAAHSLSGLCARSGAVLCCDDAETDERVDRQACREAGLRSMIVAPLPFDGRVIAVLKVVSQRTNAYGARDVRALGHLNAIMGLALGQARWHVEAEAARRGGGNRAGEEVRARVEATLATHAFRIAYQPVVRLTDGETVGFEALARFERSTEPPDWWFQAAASVGLAVELEIAVAREALRTLPALSASHYIAVNVSPATLANERLQELCGRHDARRIVVELTEHTRVDDYNALLTQVAALRGQGVRIAVDDAGAGFSTLRHVLHIEPELIKLDQSITAGIERKPGHQNLIAAMQTFAQGTAACLVAEGIESPDARDALLRLEVPYGQGFYFGKPGWVPRAH